MMRKIIINIGNRLKSSKAKEISDKYNNDPQRIIERECEINQTLYKIYKEIKKEAKIGKNTVYVTKTILEEEVINTLKEDGYIVSRYASYDYSINW